MRVRQVKNGRVHRTHAARADPLAMLLGRRSKLAILVVLGLLQGGRCSR